MFLVEIFLPQYDRSGSEFPAHELERVQCELTDRFGGVTALLQSPVHGRWKHDNEIEHDELFVFEIMTDELDEDWWMGYRHNLQDRLQQEEILIRATQIRRL